MMNWREGACIMMNWPKQSTDGCDSTALLGLATPKPPSAVLTPSWMVGFTALDWAAQAYVYVNYWNALLNRQVVTD